MPASPMVRMLLEQERQLSVTPTAREEILARMTETETVLEQGVGHIGDSLGYYIVTQRGLYYTDKEKVGFMKKREVSRFIDRADLREVYIEQSPNARQFAYVRLQGERGRVGTIWLEDDFCTPSAYDQAARVVDALAAGG